jgi:hypothetical protein
MAFSQTTHRRSFQAQSKMVPPINHNYKNALYLNNAAVTFMTHGDYHAAVAASKGALQCIKQAVNDRSDRCLDQSDEEMTVKTTMKRLANLKPASAATTSPPTSGRLIPIDVWAYDGSLPTPWPWVANVPYRRGLAIVVDDDAPFQGQNSNANDVIPAIILSNFALAHYCLGSMSLPRTSSTFDRALRLLDIGLATLGLQQRTMEVTEGNLFVATSLLGNICFVLQQCNYDAGLCCHDRLVEALDELDLLEAIANRLICMTREFTPVAGAA